MHSVDGREQCADEAEVPNCFVAALWRTSGQAPITSTTQVLGSKIPSFASAGKVAVASITQVLGSKILVLPTSIKVIPQKYFSRCTLRHNYTITPTSQVLRKSKK